MNKQRQNRKNSNKNRSSADESTSTKCEYREKNKDNEEKEKYKKINDRREKLHSILLMNSDKLESIITQISSVFIGAIASFYAIIKAPIEGKTFTALILFVICIIINLISYLKSLWSLSLEIESLDPENHKKEIHAKRASTLQNIVFVLDHLSPTLFITAVILASIGTYNEYSSYILKNQNEFAVYPRCNGAIAIENLFQKNNCSTNVLNLVEPYGFSSPPKILTPPPSPKDTNSGK